MATLVRAIHVAFVAWMLWAPFSGDPGMVGLHAVTCPCLMLHWALDSDGCALTQLEKWLRGCDDQGSFVWSVVNPVYKISDAGIKRAVWIATWCLWAVSLVWVWKHWDRVRASFFPILLATTQGQSVN